MADPKSVVSFDLEETRYNEIKTEAARLGIPISGFMRLLLSQYFDGISFERKVNDSKETSGVASSSKQK
jgi:hypothetical protein